MAPSQEVRFRDIHYDTRKQPFCLMPCRADSVRYGSLRVQATDHAGDTPRDTKLSRPLDMAQAARRGVLHEEAHGSTHFAPCGPCATQ
jgi:hypothetical protein